MQQNDPTEELEVFDAAGQPTGRAKSRAAVHLDGDWHLAFHCWILRSSGEVVLQQRSLLKDTFAGKWDAAAAGHWRFGESAQAAAREIDEELGISVPFEALRYVGRERSARRFPNGLTDREHHQVYVLVSDLPLLAFRPDPREVIGLAAFPLSDILDLLAAPAPQSRVAATEAVTVDAASGALAPARVVVRTADLVPYAPERLQRLREFRSAPDC